MSDTVKAISEYGVLVIIAGAFLFMVSRLFNAYLKHVECLEKAHSEAVTAFTVVTADMNSTISNHLDHETKAFQEMSEQNAQSFKELIRAVDRLCLLVEMPNRDYFRPEGKNKQGGTDG